MKIPDHVLDLMLIGAIGAVCFIPHGTKAAVAAMPTTKAPIASVVPDVPLHTDPVNAPGCAMPRADAPTVGRPIVAHDPCPGCGRG